MPTKSKSPFTTDSADKHKKGMNPKQKAAWVKRANAIHNACMSGKSDPIKSATGDTRAMRCEVSAIILANSAAESEIMRDEGKRVITFGFDSLKESILEIDKTNRKVVLKIIQGDNSQDTPPTDSNFHDGWSMNRNYYSKEIIKSLVPFVMDSRKMYMDHKDTFPYGRSMNDWTATVTDEVNNPWEDKSGLFAKASVLDNHNGWIFEQMVDAPEQVGISIDAIVTAEDGTLYGKTGNIITKWIYLNSPDFVTKPSAGGKFMGFSESLVNTFLFKENADDVLKHYGFLTEEFYNTDEDKDFITVDEEIKEKSEEDTNQGRNSNMPITAEEMKSLTLEMLIASGNTVVSDFLKVKEIEINKVAEETISKLKEDNSALVEKVKNLETKVTELSTEIAKRDVENKIQEKKNLIESEKKRLSLPEDIFDEEYTTLLLKMENEDIKKNLEHFSVGISKASTKIDDNEQRKTEEAKKVLTDELIISAVKNMKRK